MQTLTELRLSAPSSPELFASTRTVPALLLFLGLAACLLVMHPTDVSAQVGAPQAGVDRPGGDFWDFDLPTASPEVCRATCGKFAQCRAYTYVRPGIQGPKARCYLKDRVPGPRNNACCSSGLRTGPALGPNKAYAEDVERHFQLTPGYDRYGSDYDSFSLPANAGRPECARRCAGEPQCRSFTFIERTSSRPPACFLKSAAPQTRACENCTSGVKIGSPHIDPRDLGLGASTIWDEVYPLLVLIVNGQTTNAGGPAVPYGQGQTADYYDRLIFGPSSPNITEYSYVASNGRFAFVRADVVGPVTVATEPPNSFLVPKILSVNSTRDLKKFDRDGDGSIDWTELAILVIDNFSSGSGITQQAGSCITIPPNIRYCPSVSLTGVNSSFSNFAHEVLHAIDLEDVYGGPVMGGCLSSNETVASCTAGGGAANTNPFVSVLLDAWHRAKYGWTRPRIVSTDSPGSCARLSAPGPRYSEYGAPVVFFDPGQGVDEYFLAEYRTRQVQHFQPAAIQDASNTAPLQSPASSYDDDLSADGVVIWWAAPLNDGRDLKLLPIGILPGRNQVINSSRRGDDVFLDRNGDGLIDMLAVGENGVVDSRRVQDDTIANSAALIATADAAAFRSVPLSQPRPIIPTILNNQRGRSTVLRWRDGSRSPIGVRASPVDPTSPDVEIEWGNVQMRIDTPLPETVRVRPGDRIELRGQFGVDRFGLRRASLSNANGSTDLFGEWSCNLLRLTIPDDMTPGVYQLSVRGRTASEGVSRSIPVDVR